MGKQVNLTFRDAAGNLGTFGLTIGDTYDDGVYADLLAHVQDVIDASECQLVKAVVLRELDMTGLVNPEPTKTGDFSLITDQAILTWQSSGGKIARTTVPAPLVAMFDETGPYLEARVNELAPLSAALIASGQGEPLLEASDGLSVQFRKGWRKGHKHP